MWWRFITFCVLVTFVLFVVLSCIYGRPALHLFFHRCCEDDIENDQVIFENFGNNFLRERLVGNSDVGNDNSSFVSESEMNDLVEAMAEMINVHNLELRRTATSKGILYEEDTSVTNTDEALSSSEKKKLALPSLHNSLEEFESKESIENVSKETMSQRKGNVQKSTIY